MPTPKRKKKAAAKPGKSVTSKPKRKSKPKPKPKPKSKSKPRAAKKQPRAGLPTLSAGTLGSGAFTSLLAARGLPVMATAAVPGPPLGPMPAGVELLAKQPWKNYGQNLSTEVATVYRISNGPTKDPEVGMAALRWAVKHLAASGVSGSAFGSKWSFSRVAMNPAAMLDVGLLSLRMTFTPQQLANPAELSTLVHVQAGTTVQQLILYADNAGLSLKAMGGNCGQTLAGAISTGTHGGFTAQPGFPDMVRAIQLVAEDGTRHWLERPSRPVLSAGTIATWEAAGVQVHNDDEALFDHAVVSLGAFGVIYSLVLDTTAKYWVSLNRKALPFDDALERATLERDFGGVPPLDFATVVNPFVLEKQGIQWLGPDGSAVRTWVEKAPDGTPANPVDAAVTKQLDDAAIAPLLVTLANSTPGLVKPLVKQLLGLLYTDRVAQGPFPVAYPLSLSRSPSLGMELGVPTELARTAFDVIVQYVQGASVAMPGVIAIRTTPRSQATFSLARWDTTTCFEFCCLLVDQTEAVLTGVLDAMEASGIPFALHLGMEHGSSAGGVSWLTPARFQKMFGAQAVADWVAARKSISPKGTVFGNALTKALGLTS